MIADPNHNTKDVWIYSRFSVGWRCGLHADYTELNSCLYQDLVKMIGVPKTQNLNLKWLVTLRQPRNRYISEWQHVSRQGATWTDSSLRCGRISYGPTYFKKTCAFNFKKKLSLAEFNGCPYNLASNRQVRMLAALDRDASCYKNIFPIRLDSDGYHYWIVGSNKETVRNT